MTSIRPRSLYLDYNATAPLLPAARLVLEKTLDELGNASSQHRFGQRARARIEKARGQVAALARAKPDEIIFTSGGTEANSLAFNRVLSETSSTKSESAIWISGAEHPSVAEAAPDARVLPLQMDGQVSLDALAQALSEHAEAGSSEGARAPRLISVMAANNETGVLQPLDEVLALARQHGVALHVDAAQYLGRLPASAAIREADLITLSAHKFGGAQGAGALVVRNESLLRPLLRGGGQERYRRAGTENVAAIAAFGAAAEESLEGGSGFAALARLRDRLEAEVQAKAGAAGLELMVAGATAPRLANTSCFALEGALAELHLAALDLEGIAVSSGSACSSGKIEPSQVLLRMGWSQDRARGALRVSLGWATAETAIEQFVDSWRRVCLEPLARRAKIRARRAKHETERKAGQEVEASVALKS